MRQLNLVASCTLGRYVGETTVNRSDVCFYERKDNHTFSFQISLCEKSVSFLFLPLYCYKRLVKIKGLAGNQLPSHELCCEVSCHHWKNIKRTFSHDVTAAKQWRGGQVGEPSQYAVEVELFSYSSLRFIRWIALSTIWTTGARGIRLQIYKSSF